MVFILGVLFMHFLQGARDLSRSWVSLGLFKRGQPPCSGSISALFCVFTVLPLALQYMYVAARCRAFTTESMPASAPAKPLYHTFHARRSPPRTHWRAWGGIVATCLRLTNVSPRAFIWTMALLLFFPSVRTVNHRGAFRANKHTESKLSAGFGVICGAQTSLNLTRGLNISQARKRQLKAPYYYYFPLFPCKQDEIFGRAHPVII